MTLEKFKSIMNKPNAKSVIETIIEELVERVNSRDIEVWQAFDSSTPIKIDNLKFEVELSLTNQYIPKLYVEFKDSDAVVYKTYTTIMNCISRWYLVETSK